LFVTIHEATTCIRKSSQQAVCRVYEARPFTHVGGGFCFTGSLQQQIFAYVQAQRSNLLPQVAVNSNLFNKSQTAEKRFICLFLQVRELRLSLL
jgi:hypothetical protein